MNKYLEKIAALSSEQKTSNTQKNSHIRHYKHNGSLIGSNLAGAALGAYDLANIIKNPHRANVHLLRYVAASAVGGGLGSVVGKQVGKATYRPDSSMHKEAKFSQAYSSAKAFIKTRPSTTKWTIGGGAIGGALSGSRKEDSTFEDGKIHNVRRSTATRLSSALSGAVLGASIGASIGTRKDFLRANGGARGGSYYRSRGGSAGNTRTSRTIHDIEKDLGFHASPKTKTEAKSHYRKMASKYHPDKHEGEAAKKKATEQMAKVNRAWDEFNSHPRGFTKLANAYLVKAAGIDLKKVKALAKANPAITAGVVLGGAEGATSTRKMRTEGQAKYRLRQLKNTVVGAGFGGAAGKIVQEGLKAVSK